MRKRIFLRLRLSACVAALALIAISDYSRAEEPFDYFTNSWNVIGLKDYKQGARITPENEILLVQIAKRQNYKEADRAVLRFGKERLALSAKQTKTLREGWMPIVLLSAQDGAVRYEFTLWATPLPTVADWKKAFDWPTEGENFLNWIAVKITNVGGEKADAAFAVERKGKTNSMLHENTWTLAAGETVEDCVRIPFLPVPDAKAFDREDPKVWLERTAEYWRNLLAGGAKFEVPCRKALEALHAAHVCQFIANDHGELHGGEGFYDTFWIRDGAYQLLELEEAGFNEAAAKAVVSYLSHQLPDGRFESQKGQFDANGQAQWVLWQYAKITGDRAWLEKAYPQMLRAARWTIKTLGEVPADSPFPGVLPAALADGEYLWAGKNRIVGYDLWNFRGLICTADAARMLGKDADAKELASAAEDYRKAIDAACKKTGVDYFPPSWELAGTFWGNTETLWPTELFPVDDPRVIATIRQARKGLGGGFIEGTIQWIPDPSKPVPQGQGVIHPYMSAYTTMASLARGEDEQVVEDFYWYLLHSSASHAFPEGLYYEKRVAWHHLIPHVTGAANYAFILRHMLVHEKGDELHLLAAVPDGWLEEGKGIRIENAPTHFGPMSLVVRGTAKGVEVQLTKPARNPPRRIVLHLPQSRPLQAALSEVEVVVRPDQKFRWDFPAVVKKYLKQ
jgi:hypothetical protein